MMKRKTIQLFKKVQKVPYYLLRKRNSEKLFELNKGCCAEKVIWLGKRFEEMGLSVRYYTIKFRWADLPIPDNIINLDEPIGYHLSMKVKLDGKWIWVDPTWDTKLEKVGFPVTINWNGIESTKIAVHPIEIEEYVPEDPSTTNLNNKFINKLNRYLEEIRSTSIKEKILCKKIPDGKLVRVKIKYDNVIRSISITGDFFIHPEEALEKIEHSLVGTSIDLSEKELEEIINHITKNVKFIGFSTQDLAQIIKEAIT